MKLLTIFLSGKFKTTCSGTGGRKTVIFRGRHTSFTLNILHVNKLWFTKIAKLTENIVLHECQYRIQIES